MHDYERAFSMFSTSTHSLFRQGQRCGIKCLLVHNFSSRWVEYVDEIWLLCVVSGTISLIFFVLIPIMKCNCWTCRLRSRLSAIVVQ